MAKMIDNVPIVHQDAINAHWLKTDDVWATKKLSQGTSTASKWLTAVKVLTSPAPRWQLDYT